MSRIEIYTDGSTRPKNPGKGASAAICLTGDKVIMVGEYLGDGITNNVAELYAIEMSVNLCRTEGWKDSAIFSDSEYSVCVINGTYNASSNLAQIKRIRSSWKALEEDGGKLELCWIRGHDNSTWNNFADKYAREITEHPGYKQKLTYSKEEFEKQGNEFLKSIGGKSDR